MTSAKKVCTLAFLRRDDEILLAMKKRGFGTGRWNGVGGKVEPHEDMQDSLIRECQEEIGVTPLEFTRVAVHDFVMHEGNEPWHMHVHVFIATKWKGKPREGEEVAPRWFKLRDIPYDDMWQDDIIWLPLVLRDKKLIATFMFDKDDDMLSADLKLVNTL